MRMVRMIDTHDDGTAQTETSTEETSGHPIHPLHSASRKRVCPGKTSVRPTENPTKSRRATPIMGRLRVVDSMKILNNRFGGTTGQRCTAPPSSLELGKTSRDASKEAVTGEENLTNRPDAKPAIHRAAQESSQ